MLRSAAHARPPGDVARWVRMAGRLDEAEFATRVREVAWRSRASGGQSQAARAEAFGLIHEAVRRVAGKTPYPVQQAAGWAMASGRLAEMQTGEGKTLTAVFPAAWFAFAGRGCHVLTDNDYLAERDAEELAPVFEKLGLSVGCVTAELSDDDRRVAYERDVTYATVQECGFDFLRDRLRLGVDADEAGRDAAHGLVQRPLWAAVVDEADSILLDSARTPLIIAAQAPVDPVDEALARWADGLATRLGPEADFVAEPAHKRVTLTTDGCRRVSLAGVPHGCAAEHRYELVETALNARLLHQRDRDYVVTPEDEIGIIDIGTGRQKEGSRWQHGLHRAIEIKEGVPLAGESASTASITVQRYVRGYRKRCGMTGTSRPSAGEIRRTYRLKTVVIPTNRPCIRRGRPTRIYATAAAKHEAIAVECRDMLASGRAVLIGTPSIEISEQVAAALDRHGIDSMLLHARKRDREARIVAEAGQPGRVTVATNMAGRGTDIKLAESVRDAGGLHVIATEMHHSRRVDRQLIGRAARQGDPGSYRFMLSLEDELLDALPAARRGRLRRSVAGREKLPADRWIGLFRRLQKRVDAQHRRDRAYATRTEKRSRAALRRMGLCPYLESAAE